MTSAVVGRLAPSPSGSLHLGHAHTFLLAWLRARKAGGTVVLRMEDLDASRCRPGYVEAIERDLRWLGVDWDGPALLQSSRLEPLRAAGLRLVEQGLAYPCVCTRAELQDGASAPHVGGVETRYPGTCRNKYRSVQHAMEVSGRHAAIRLRVEAGERQFVDAMLGLQTVDVASEVGDFVLINRIGVPSYQLAVVVDDAHQGVTEVVRGGDLLGSTGRQLLVHEALHLPVPTYYHAPLVVDELGVRLAKRRDDLSLASLRQLGVKPEAIVGWVASVLGYPPVRAMPAAQLLSLPFAPPRWPREVLAPSARELLSAKS